MKLGEEAGLEDDAEAVAPIDGEQTPQRFCEREKHYRDASRSVKTLPSSSRGAYARTLKSLQRWTENAGPTPLWLGLEDALVAPSYGRGDAAFCRGRGEIDCHATGRPASSSEPVRTSGTDSR